MTSILHGSKQAGVLSLRGRPSSFYSYPSGAVAHNSHLRPSRYDQYDQPVRRAGPSVLPIVAIDRASATPLYRQIYEGYRDAIVAHRLRPGQRLPSTRGLAAELQISRIPALNAFEQLLAEGYFESRGHLSSPNTVNDRWPASAYPPPGGVSCPARPWVPGESLGHADLVSAEGVGQFVENLLALSVEPREQGVAVHVPGSVKERRAR